MTEQTEYWTAQQCADNWGIALRTWHGYVARDQAPKPWRHEGRTPLWLADTVRVEGATRPRAGLLADIRLPLTDVLSPLRVDMTLAFDKDSPAEERERSVTDALDTLKALRQVLAEVREVARSRAEAEYETAERSADPGAQDRSEVWTALAEDLRRVDADLDRRRRAFYTASHPDEPDPVHP
ncbi:hypothetical protein AB0D49_08355 [Streptomyces sp. NPDC048290]|uniref:hypothetical protein n=1 Tax=Streptomyces sp. NPDC048290 TaxID=3155811 RepID=UPI003421C4AF